MEHTKVLEILKQEQQEFNSQMEQLIQQGLKGKIALFQKGSVQGTFDSTEEAYAAGVERFGPDAIFLVACIEQPREPFLDFSGVKLTWAWDLEGI